MTNVHLQEAWQFSGPAPEKFGSAVILIHGRTHSPKEMFALTERISLSTASYVALQANGNSWYPAKFMQPVEENQPFLDYSLETVNEATKSLNAQGVTNNNIFFLGFSQGACLACEYVYRNPQAWGGLIAFTGGLIGPENTIWPETGKLGNMPVILGNSDEDKWVPVSRTKETASVFKKMGASVTLKIYPGLDHSVNDDEIDLARSMLSTNFSK